MSRILMTVSAKNCIYVIEKAHEMGHQIIIANSYTTEQAPLKAHADEAYIIDASDTQAMVEFVKTHNIDGIFITGSDAHLRFYCDICAATGLNAYCTINQVNIISDKIHFKEYCAKHGLNTISEYPIKNIEDIKDIDICYPVMVKSPDNAGGSKGMTLVYREGDLPAAIELAKANSPTRSVVVEHYIDGDEFVINYMFINGEPFVLYTKDYCKNIVDGMVMRDNAMISPSKYEKLFYEKADKKLREMFADIGMENGIIFLQCFVENDELYFFEGGCRAGGSDEYFLWNSIYGVDFIKAMLSFAIKHDYDIPNFKDILLNTKQEKIESVLNVLVGAGKIKSISGVNEVKDMPEVFCATLLRDVGDTVANDSTSGQIALRVMIEANSADDYLRIIDEIYNALHFESEDGREMLIPHIDLGHWVK